MDQSFQNTIQFYYLSGIIESDDLDEISRVLGEVDLKVNEWDRSGVYQANADDFTNIVSLVINTPLLITILKEVVTVKTS